ncbi:ATP-dependent nuclease [Clostridium butyricum]|uniref:ATP-dependent nuclease n=1 Tax=Clostridium butyricum TaxID=1492 RepID=UPI002AB129D3|nr:AAA family ATPase [Clostridium butyricum]
MLKKIRIQKFKSIEDLTINCNDNFNVIIGENSIGKTSIFEAIHLWKMCYDWNTKKDKKGFYSVARNIPFSEMEYLRVFSDSDLFPENCQTKDAIISISLNIVLDDEEFILGFKISKVSNISNAYLHIDYEEPEQFNEFANKVDGIAECNISNIIVISESRPIANIIAKEPYMYRAQVLEKISKGKGYEVLRNKIIRSSTSTERIEEHLKNVFGIEYKFNEVDKERTYIDLKVNGTNILSQGSGFLQIAEIFSSLEYVDAGIHVLLIDEPDSHIHAKLQKRLISELRSINNSQLFIISHNDKFLADIDEEEIRFISNDIKNGGIVDVLPQGSKGIVLENLIGALDRIEKLKYAECIMLLEGKTDYEFINNIIDKYERLSGTKMKNYFIDTLNGIDTLHEKLLIYSKAVKGVVSNDSKWIIVRDNDCLPPSKQIRAGNQNIKDLAVTNKEIKFQNGYGVESTFISEPIKFSKILINYYELPIEELNNVRDIILELNGIYVNRVKSMMDEVNIEFESHYKRQKEKRQEKIYNDFEFRDILKEINSNNIQNIMTKRILSMYLEDLHEKLREKYSVIKGKLTEKTIFDAYYSSINDLSDILDCHLELIRCLE